MDAPELSLPKDVAFKLGAGTGKRYLVMQVHYANVDKFLDGSTDDSGIILKGQKEPVNHLAGVYFLVTGGYVNANSKQNFESACEMTEDVEIVPFAYRTHTHKLGKVNSGYLVRNDPIVGDKDQTWKEIGRRSPQLPQMFYPVSNKMTIGKGDILAARCTIENTRNHDVRIGATGDDEMCNFYIMYYTKGDLLESNVCFTNGPPNWFFSDFRDYEGNSLQLSKVPSDISEVPEDQVELLKKEGGMNNMHMKMNENVQDDIGSMDFIPKSNTKVESEDDRLLYMYLKNLLSSRYEQ